jgi:tetratricopeptide (TPR) repeat protein
MRIQPIFIALALSLSATAAPADGLVGPYLAANQAAAVNDYREATRYYSRALVKDRQNPALMNNLITSQMGMGDVKSAVPVAKLLLSQDPHASQIADLVRMSDTALREKGAVLDPGTAGGLITDLLNAWEALDGGDMTAALDGFDQIIAQNGLQEFGFYHKGMALAMVGDAEGAAQAFTMNGEGEVRLTRRGLIAYAQVLAQLGKSTEALELLNRDLPSGSNLMADALRADIEAGKDIAFSIVTNPNDGQAEAFYTIAAALRDDATPAVILLYARLAGYLHPGHTDALLLVARSLEELGQYAIATEVYGQVPLSSPSSVVAWIGRAHSLMEIDKPDAAIETLRQLVKAHPGQGQALIAMADTLRQLDKFEEAVTFYDRAIDLLETPQQNDWMLYFARGVAEERAGQWEAAEADFKQALELNPDHPAVLNYLGYSYVEQRRNLDEALQMIEKASDLQPQSGYIIDSLGWVLYRLGRFEEAVEPMERAVELEPIDPTVNDHLGDVYWMVGRKREAQFQWHRAISFEPEDKDLARIRLKLSNGLDAVLGAEKAGDLAVADGH